jgi:hypothetical protein
VLALQDMFDRVRNLIDARANEPSMAHVPGGTTGPLESATTKGRPRTCPLDLAPAAPELSCVKMAGAAGAIVI